MNEKRFSLAEAQREFAKKTNGRVWELLGKTNRTLAEDEEIVLAAQASLYHWTQIGTGVHAQRGQWLLAHVYTVLEQPDLAMQHASRCMELTEAYPTEMKDFDLAYAYEALARAYGLQGNVEKAKETYAMAADAGAAISNAEDKEIFMGDFHAGGWYGIV